MIECQKSYDRSRSDAVTVVGRTTGCRIRHGPAMPQRSIQRSESLTQTGSRIDSLLRRMADNDYVANVQGETLGLQT